MQKKALDVLKNFRKIHTIGWLFTYSPSHNYEFSVLTWEGSSLSSKANLVIEYDAKQTGALRINTSLSECKAIELVGKNGRKYIFCAHNEADAKSIYATLVDYRKICIIGEGADNIGQIRSVNNLIWLEK